MCCISRIYHFKISHWLERLKHCPLGAYFVLIFCHYLFHWDIFLYFIFNILWFWQSRRWSESFFWYCISRVLANTWGIIWMTNTIDIQYRTLDWKKKQCYVKLLLSIIRWWSKFSSFYLYTFTATPLIRT